MTTEFRHPIFARFVAFVAARAEGSEDDDLRRELLSGLLCSVPSQASTLAELKRVVRPGGELRFYEHVDASAPRYSRFQRAVGRVSPHLAGGCHPDRDTGGAIEEAGFRLERVRRFVVPSVVEAPVAPRILGAARRP
jgi:hypothetical protein